MNRIILIGNGFDLAHGLKTSYKDFIDDFWEIKLNSFLNTLHDRSIGVIRQNDNVTQTSEGYYRYNDKDISIDFLNFAGNQPMYNIDISQNLSGFNKFYSEISYFRIKNYSSNLKYNNSFLEIITNKKQLQNWVDIEDEYYTALLGCLNETEKVKKLNEDFNLIQIALEKYLIKSLKTPVSTDHQIIQNINSLFSHPLYTNKQNNIENFLFLNFNYTNIEKLYTSHSDKIIHIHGELLNKLENPIIFGYGDETGEKYKLIEDKNINMLLDNIKSIKYFETRNYIDLLGFIDSDEYEIFIMGHSCGISDRTLLKILFEHNNCLSIKIYYHKINSVMDNYSDVVRNISRNFTDKSLMRKKVINKKDSIPLTSSSEENTPNS
jgi:hypothetical protein